MKNRFSLLLTCALFSIGVFSADAQALGDVNGSGVVDIVDALLVAQYYVGLNPANFNQVVADVDCSGPIDIVDALLIARFYVGLISQFPCASTAAPTAVPTASPTTPPIDGCTCPNGCSAPVQITLPFTQEGAGEFCFVTSCTIGTANSWNLDALSINGTSYLNTYASSFPAPINGLSYIYYKGSYAYSHLEITGACGGTVAPTTEPTVAPTPTSTPNGTPTSVPTVGPTPVAGSPVSNYTFWPQVISTSDTVYFYGLASYNVGGTITGYSWNFGDGSTGSGANTSHKYTATGNYTATLTVTNATGLTAVHSETVSVSLSSGQSTTDISVYNFEDGTAQGFSTNNADSSIANTTDKAYSGTHSIKWTINTSASEMVEIVINGGAAKVNPGQKVLFRVWVPSGAPIDNVQPYVAPHNADWSTYSWNADWRAYGSITKDAWNEFSVLLPDTTDTTLTQQIGVQMKTTGSSSGLTLYVDSIDWASTKTPPKAGFDYSPDKPATGASVSFDAVGSADAMLKSGDPDGTISSYAWNFGDGTTGTGASATHTYAQEGKYPVTLTVTDNDSLVSSLTRVVWCGQSVPAFAPPLSVSGTKILDANGVTFIPKAISIVDSLTWTLDDFKMLKKEWKVDMIRLPYITDRWYYNVDAATRETYLAAFDKYLDWTYQCGIYVLLDGFHEGGSTGNADFHWTACQDAWKILAPRLKDRTHIIWEVYNEPYEITWANWVPKAEALIDIINSYNPVVKVFAVPGTNWAQDFDVRTLKVDRPNVIYSAHPYPHVYNAVWNPAAWDAGFGYIATEGYAPVLATEMYYPLFDKGDRTAYGEPIMKYFADRGIGWFAWIWGGWGSGPASRDPNSYRTDCWQFLWEDLNGIWNP